MMSLRTPWWIYIILLLTGVSTAVTLYEVFKREKQTEKTMQNEEIVSWVDWQGKPREIIVHRKVRET